MDDVVKYVFKIKGGYRINTLPMERLAEYMAELARMLGEPSRVHFVEIIESSIGIVHAVERETSGVIDRTICEIQCGAAPVANMAAYREINKKLRNDESYGEFVALNGPTNILPFPGKNAPEPITLAGVTEFGNIDGVIIGVGGTRDEVSVSVQSDDAIYKRCVAKKPLAKELARFIFEGELRLYGQGKWNRNEDGVWTLQKFHIDSYEPLDNSPLESVISDLRSIHDSEWGRAEDFWAEAMDLRHGGVQH